MGFSKFWRGNLNGKLMICMRDDYRKVNKASGCIPTGTCEYSGVVIC